MTIRSNIQKLTPGAPVILYDIQIGATTLHFADEVNKLGNDIVWGGVTYVRWNCVVTGFERNSTGVLPRPTIRVGNLSGTFGELIKAYDDLVGCKVTRRRTFARYLDAINFPGGINPTADPLAELPSDVYFVVRKVNENPVYVEFELAAKGLDTVKLPRRQVIQNVCTWGYRSPECGYTGGPVANSQDVATSDSTKDVCGKRLASCKLRFGESAELPYGGFPSAGLFR